MMAWRWRSENILMILCPFSLDTGVSPSFFSSLFKWNWLDSWPTSEPHCKRHRERTRGDITSCQGHHAFRFEKGFHNYPPSCSLQTRWEGSRSTEQKSEAQRREVTHQRIPRRPFPQQCCLSRLGPEAGNLGFSVRARSARRLSHGSPSSLWIPCPRSGEEGVDFSRKSTGWALLGCFSDFWFQAVRAPLRALLICRMEESHLTRLL